MVGWFLVRRNNAHHIVASACRRQQALVGVGRHIVVDVFGIETANHLDSIFTFAHRERQTCFSASLYREQMGFSQHLSACHSCTRNKHIGAFFQLSTFLKVGFPRSIFWISKKLCNTIFYFTQREMAVIFRVVVILCRLVC